MSLLKIDIKQIDTTNIESSEIAAAASINTVQGNLNSLNSTVDSADANLYNTYTSLSDSINSMSGGGSLSAVNITSRSLASNTTITSTQSTFSIGPFEIADGVTLTIQSGGRHVIL